MPGPVKDSAIGEAWQVRPASPPRGARRWAVTAADRYALRWLIQGTWVFDTDLDPLAMKQGLARLLEAYPILCGRVVKGSAIELRDGGVPFTVAEQTHLTVADLGAPRTEVTGFADRREARRIERGQEPLLTARLTRLRDGWVLAVCGSHGCLDGSGFYSLVRNWGRATRGRSFPPPIFDRPPSLQREPRSRAMVAGSAREADWQKLSILDLLRILLSLVAPGSVRPPFPRSRARLRGEDRTFVAHFSPEALRRLRDALTRDSGCDRLSTNSAIVGHVAGCAVRLLGLDPESQLTVSAVVDYRQRVDGLLAAFANNAVVAVPTPPIAAGTPPAEIAACFQRRLEPMLRQPSEELLDLARLSEEVSHHRLLYANYPLMNLLGRRPSHFFTNSFSRFPIYDVDFGTEARPARPVRVIPQDLGDPILLWPAPPAAGGLELYFGGAFARALRALADADPWLAELRRFEPAVDR